MGKRLDVKRLLAGLIFFALLLGGPLTETARTQDEEPAVSEGAESSQEAGLELDEVEDAGWLTIFFDPSDTILRAPGEILLTDPLRRRVGWAVNEGKAVVEIEGSFYEDSTIDDEETGAPVVISKVLAVWQPAEGKYLLDVIGTAARTYSLGLHIQSADPDAPSQDVSVQDVPIGKDELHQYEFTYVEKNTEELVLERVR